MTLKDLPIGKTATVQSVGGDGALRQHFLDMGLIPQADVTGIADCRADVCGFIAGSVADCHSDGIDIDAGDAVSQTVTALHFATIVPGA